MHPLKFAFLILFLCVCCNRNQSGKNPISTVSDSVSHADDTSYSSFRYVEAFEGTLLCADCPGIITEIVFINDNLSYHETNTYLERNVTTKLSGSYTTDRGYKADDDATVYVLDDDKAGHERRFLKLDDNTLLMLDQNGEIIDTTSKYKLART